MGLSYDKLNERASQRRNKSEEEKELLKAGKFPDCKGLYPDCPEKPSLKNRACRTCPKTEELEEELY